MIIYKITNKINSKIYIGQTIRSLDVRKYEYKRAKRIKRKCNNYLINSFNKYGFDNFEFSIIDTATSIKELNEKEIYYINLFNSCDRNIGYNIELGGNNSLASEETRKKMSASRKGKKQTEEWVKKRIPTKGSDEAKKHGRPKTNLEIKYLKENSPKYWLGKTRSEETKQKVSETKKKQALKPLNTKKVKAIDVDTNEIKIFDSISDAHKELSIRAATISSICKGIIKNKGKYIFTFID
jgi:group I intron endonuclease